MFFKHVKKKPQFILKFTKLKNIQLEKKLEAVNKSIKNELLRWQFSLVSLATVFLSIFNNFSIEHLTWLLLQDNEFLSLRQMTSACQY